MTDLISESRIIFLSSLITIFLCFYSFAIAMFWGINENNLKTISDNYGCFLKSTKNKLLMQLFVSYLKTHIFGKPNW